MKTKPQVQTLKGFRDFLPTEARKRAFVTSKIKASFELFGFEPLQTPTLEYASLLTGKYGEEADKLLYTFEDRGGRQVGLRYDQTVPTARVLAQYQNELPKYFRRYQIQNVFRADKPQKGRYREFTQCDVDIFGASSPLVDAEFLAVVNAVFENLGLKSAQIEFNDRELLIGSLEEFANQKVSVLSIIQSIDKLDKLSPEQVIAELMAKGLDQTLAEAVIVKLDQIEKSSNLVEIEQKALALGVPADKLVFNPKLARGLDYYTGIIFEVKIAEYGNVSVGGGGRYDQLIEDLAGLKMPAIGIGLGFDRIVEVCDDLDLIPQDNMGSQVLVTIFDDDQSEIAALKLAQELRQNGIKTELYLKRDRLGKQFKLAQQKNIPWVTVIGQKEIEQDLIGLKNMSTGQQDQLSLEKVILKIKASN